MSFRRKKTMGLACSDRVIVRDATAEDMSALSRLKQPEALHRDRLRNALSPTFRYVVSERSGQVIGFGCLVFVRPQGWSDAHDTSRLPALVDLQIEPAFRGQGYGANLINALEQMAAASGFRELFLRVDPVNNHRAYSLYKRLGYLPLQANPYMRYWEFVDSRGGLHKGDDWTVDMAKSL
jgi:GNAT superfamily N-acetyltransferase